MFLHYWISQHHRSQTIGQDQRHYLYSVEKLAKREGNQHELCINLIIVLNKPNESLSFFLPTKHYPRNNHVMSIIPDD